MSRKVSALESLLHNGDIEKILSSDLSSDAIGEAADKKSSDESTHRSRGSDKVASTESHSIDDASQAHSDNSGLSSSANLLDKDLNRSERSSAIADTVQQTTSQPKRSRKRSYTSVIEESTPKEGYLALSDASDNSVDNQTPSSNSIVFIDTATIRPWQFADRPDNEISGIEELADDIKHNGQSTPILLRKLSKAENQIQYEYIFGCRRLAACRLANIRVRAIVTSPDDLPDTKAFALMFGENEQRENISSWARSISFENIIKSGIYKSKRELSLAIGKHESYIKNLTAYSKIPKEVAKAIGPMTNISINTAQEIEMLARTPQNVGKLIESADQIKQGMSPKSLRDKILGRPKRSTSQRYNGKKGASLLLSQKNDGTFNIKVSSNEALNKDFDKLAEMLLNYLEE